MWMERAETADGDQAENDAIHRTCHGVAIAGGARTVGGRDLRGDVSANKLLYYGASSW